MFVFGDGIDMLRNESGRDCGIQSIDKLNEPLFQLCFDVITTSQIHANESERRRPWTLN